jgi:effector-binding domain-containing protein
VNPTADSNAIPEGAGRPAGDTASTSAAMRERAGLPVVEIVELEVVWVAAIRSIVAAEDVPDFMSDALALVATALREAGLAPAGPPFARYYDSGPDGLDMAAGFPVAEPFLGASDAHPLPESGAAEEAPASAIVHPDELPAGPAAVATHVGSYQGLEAAWIGLRERVGAMGRQLGKDPWEVYFIGPGSGVDEAEWRTELVWPLRGDAHA